MDWLSAHVVTTVELFFAGAWTMIWERGLGIGLIIFFVALAFGSQMLAGIPATSASAEPLAVHQVAAGNVSGPTQQGMLQDIEARRTTEIDYLNGGIARFGAELGVPAPLNDTIAALIRGIEASWETN